MAKVSTRTPPLISLYFCQERGDPDYGSCLWAVFNFDLERYELSITSDCGNYAYGWVPTHKSESFMHLMARLDSGYLLDKLASPCVINEEATFEAVKELMEAWGVDFSETDRWGDPVFDMDEIKDCCYQSNERDVHDALERKFEGTSMETCDDYDFWGCIQKDFTTNAKKIVQVFMDHIRPMCKKLSLTLDELMQMDGKPVWVICDEGFEPLAFWALVEVCEESIFLTNNLGGRTEYAADVELEDDGITVYHRKPEEGTV